MDGVVTSRFLLIFFNSILFTFGIVLLVFGVTVLLNSYAVIKYAEPSYFHVLQVVSIPDVIGNIAIFLVTAGGVSVTLSILGCCASATYSKYTLLLYWSVLLLLVLFEIAVIIFIAVYPELRRAEVKKKTYESLKSHFKPVTEIESMTWKDLEDVRSGDSVADSWLMMQMRFSCCGANDYLDYQTFLWKNVMQVLGKSVSTRVPVQCCKHLSRGQLGTSENITRCLAAEPQHINTEGCCDVVMNALQVFGSYAIGLVACSLGIQVILLSAAVYLWSKLQQVS